MVAPGMYRSARGKLINMEVLRDMSKRPMNKRPEKSEINKIVIPQGEQITVRGNRPLLGAASHTIGEVVAPVRVPSRLGEASVAPGKSGSEKSIADFTKLNIDEAVHIRPVKEGEQGMKPRELAEKRILTDIVHGLQQQAPTALAEAERIERAQKRRKGKDREIDPELV